MEKKAKSLIAIASLALLAACECGTDSNVVVEDEALRGSAADFIANAGDRVYFAFDKSNVSPEAEATLLRQAEWCWCRGRRQPRYPSWRPTDRRNNQTLRQRRQD